MRKFTNINTEDNSLNENVKIIKDKENINKLLDLLTLEINGSEEDVVLDYNIKTNEKFYKGIKNYINELYHKEKLDLLEKAKKNYYLNNNSDWIDEEIEYIKESIKK